MADLHHEVFQNKLSTSEGIFGVERSALLPISLFLAAQAFTFSNIVLANLYFKYCIGLLT
jgi:hypothetical protein